MDLKERARQLQKDIPAVVLALKDAETPAAAKVLALLAVAYALSPIDLIPDFIPVIGYLDDVILLPALIALTVKLIPQPVWERCREEAQAGLEDAGPRKWLFAIPVVVVWLLIIYLVVKAVWL